MSNNGHGDNFPSDMPAQTLTKSVTKGDQTQYLGAGVVNFLIPAFGAVPMIGGLPPELPSLNSMTPYSKARDTILVMCPRVEGYWANAQHIAKSKIISRGIQFLSPVTQRIDRMNEMFRTCDGRRGFASFLDRHLSDFLNCSNGAWVEIERVSRNPGAKIVSFNHIDSLRCWRTGDPDTPVIYWDLQGQYHELRWWECFNVTDDEASRAGWWYGGECASERAYQDVRALSAMTKFFDEKITGGGYNKFVFVPGTTVDQIEDAKKTAESNQIAKGILYYNGVLFIPYYGTGESFKDKIEVDTKGMPDGWDREKELDIRLLNYANALGIAPFELDPKLTARGAMGVGQQSQIIDENEKGRGMGSWEKKFLNHINNLITPDATTAMLVTIDLREEKQKAENAKLRAEARAAMRGTLQAPGEITPEQSLLMAIESDDVPDEFKDSTTPTDEIITTEEKPTNESEQAQSPEAKQSALQSAPVSQPEETPIVTKEARAFLRSELAHAKQILEQVKA